MEQATQNLAAANDALAQEENPEKALDAAQGLCDALAFLNYTAKILGDAEESDDAAVGKKMRELSVNGIHIGEFMKKLHKALSTSEKAIFKAIDMLVRARPTDENALSQFADPVVAKQKHIQALAQTEADSILRQESKKTGLTSAEAQLLGNGVSDAGLLRMLRGMIDNDRAQDFVEKLATAIEGSDKNILRELGIDPDEEHKKLAESMKDLPFAREYTYADKYFSGHEELRKEAIDNIAGGGSFDYEEHDPACGNLVMGSISPIRFEDNSWIVFIYKNRQGLWYQPMFGRGISPSTIRTVAENANCRDISRVMWVLRNYTGMDSKDNITHEDIRGYLGIPLDEM